MPVSVGVTYLSPAVGPAKAPVKIPSLVGMVRSDRFGMRRLRGKDDVLRVRRPGLRFPGGRETRERDGIGVDLQIAGGELRPQPRQRGTLVAQWRVETGKPGQSDLLAA